MGLPTLPFPCFFLLSSTFLLVLSVLDHSGMLEHLDIRTHHVLLHLVHQLSVLIGSIDLLGRVTVGVRSNPCQPVRFFVSQPILPGETKLLSVLP